MDTDDIPRLGERRYEPRLAIEAGLEFIMGQIAELPTRRQLMQCAGWVLLGLCVIALVGLRMWHRYIAARIKKEKAAAVSCSDGSSDLDRSPRRYPTGGGIRLIGRARAPHLHLPLVLCNG
jgi:hypothetical protein